MRATGAVTWRKEFFETVSATWPLYRNRHVAGRDRGLLIAHVGGNDNGALTAFDAGLGVEKWQWTGDGPAYASPIVVELGGTRQVVTETQNRIW